MCVNLVVLRKICEKSHCSPGKITQFAQILHDRRSQRSRQISTLCQCIRCAYKMPTRQNANQTKCQPDKMPKCPDFLLWLVFCPSHFLVGILSGPSQHVLAFCQNHEKCRHLSECECFVRSVDFLKYRQKANLAKSQSQMTLVGHSYEAHLHNSKCSEDDIR